jgi:lysophospholipase L1-like esterase
MRAFCIGLFAAALLAAAARAEPIIIGDSICEGLAAATGKPGITRRGAVTTRLADDLRRAPRGTKVWFCASTNDAAARLTGFDAAVERVLATARAMDLTLLWIGPVRTTKSWDSYSDQADTLLALRLWAAGVRYVSLRAIKFERSELAGDGVHFSPKGYRRIAAMVRS